VRTVDVEIGVDRPRPAIQETAAMKARGTIARRRSGMVILTSCSGSYVREAAASEVVTLPAASPTALSAVMIERGRGAGLVLLD